MSARAIVYTVGISALLGLAVLAVPSTNRSHQRELAAALHAQGLRQVSTSGPKFWNTCMNGKGGTRWRHGWRGVDARGQVHTGSACVGGLFMKPAISEN